jgi:hypothetical protein
MVAASTDKFCKVGLPGNATTLAAPGHATGGTSINVDSTSLWPTDTGVIFAIDTTTLISGVETRNTGSYTVWEGVVTGATSIGSMVLKYGTDQNYSAGATTRVYVLPTSARENLFVDGILIEHDQDGTHKNITTDTVTTTGNADLKTVITDTISEKTSAAGVTIDGLNIKDSKIGIAGLNNPYKMKATKTGSNQTLSSSYTPVLITLTSEAYDTNSNYDTSTSKYTVPVTGWYLCSGSVRFQNGTAGECGMSINNAGLGWFRTPVGASEFTVMSASGPAYFTAGQEVYLMAYAQNGGTVYKDLPDQTYLSIHLLSV